jgi:hypothetical protein
MITADPTTVVIILAADVAAPTGVYVTPPQQGVQITQLTAQNPRVQVTDSSTYVFYTVTQGVAPSSIWMDAVDGSGAGLTALSVISPVTSSTTASPGQLLLVSSGDVTITLSSAFGVAGQSVVVKDISGSGNPNIRVAALTGQTVNGPSGPVTITSGYGSVRVVSDGANWWTID